MSSHDLAAKSTLLFGGEAMINEGFSAHKPHGTLSSVSYLSPARAKKQTVLQSFDDLPQQPGGSHFDRYPDPDRDPRIRVLLVVLRCANSKSQKFVLAWLCFALSFLCTAAAADAEFTRKKDCSSVGGFARRVIIFEHEH